MKLSTVVDSSNPEFYTVASVNNNTGYEGKETGLLVATKYCKQDELVNLVNFKLN